MTYQTRTAHATDDALEMYSLQRMSEDELPAFEEHLLICNTCQDRLDETDQYIAAMKAATKSLKQEQPSYLSKVADWFRVYPQQSALGFGLAAALAVGVFVQIPQSPVQIVEMSATRSAGPASHVRSGVKPQLKLGIQGLSVFPSYQVDVVDQKGTSAWQGTVAPKDEKLSVSIPSALSSGAYYVRVYSSPSRDELLREYSLLVD